MVIGMGAKLLLENRIQPVRVSGEERQVKQKNKGEKMKDKDEICSIS